MKIKIKNCPECGEEARGTVEELSGVALFVDDDGDDVEYLGETEIWWDEQRTRTNEKGEVELVCEGGHSWFSAVEHEEDGDDN